MAGHSTMLGSMPQGPLRLLILAAQYFPAVGGSEGQARLLAREFARRGHAVQVWTRRLEAGHARSETLDGVLIRRLGPILGVGPAALERLIFVYELYRRLRREASSFDVILANQLQYPAVAATLACRGRGLPVVGRSSASGPQSEMLRPEWTFRVQRALLTRYIDHVVALGPVTRDDCQAAGFRASLITLIPNGLEMGPVAPPRAPTPPLRVVWLGKLRREKRADLAIRAWRESGIEGELRIVGDGPLLDSIETLVREAETATGSVRMVGLVNDPRPELASAHMFVQSSDTEGLSNALLEAMSSGCGIVATDVGETRSVLGGLGVGEAPRGSYVRAEGGLLVRPGDAPGLAAGLRALLDDNLRASLGKAAEARCRAHHGLGEVASRYEELFARLLETGRGGRAA